MSDNKDNGFTYEGASMLYEYLEDFESMEFDMIAIRCEYSEYTIEEYKKEFPEMVKQWDEYIKENEIGKDGFDCSYDDDMMDYLAGGHHEALISYDTSKDIILLINM